ncbi:HAD family hydrolase [Salinibacterium sp. M195]|uniref:HAD family hydrolase n=1 Tax=Salinibacterium sp. M195 TaxID=2583374 RepID=UPI001C63AFEA|nr:HAD hydrolase-like protein [Salinibacterium sp. M195]QYH35941.1 HAD family hydrolase [Salinibacterium sp. M195]
MKTNILWDIDGTLIRNSREGATVYRDAFTHVTGAPPVHFISNPHGMTEGQLLAQLLELNGHPATLLDDILVELDARTQAAHDSGFVREAVVGGHNALHEVAKRGWTNALLTGNGPQHSRIKLVAAGYSIDDFDWDYSFFGDRSPDRHHLTSLVAPLLGEGTHVIVGDTPNDGLAADSASLPFIAVATGAFSVADLRETGAVLVVDDLVQGLDDVLGAIAALSQRR